MECDVKYYKKFSIFLLNSNWFSEEMVKILSNNRY